MSHPCTIRALAAAALVGAAGTAAADAEAPGPFALDPAKLDPIRFTRLDDGVPLRARSRPEIVPSSRTPSGSPSAQFSFSLAPGRPDFSWEGAYGLGALFGAPEITVDGVPAVPGTYPFEEGTVGLSTGLNDGFRYSAGVRIEHEDADIDGTAYVSSSLLGLSYGRLGRLWYGGIDVNLEQFADEHHEDRPDLLSLDVTTGRRLGITGLGTDAPLWLLSLRGDFDLLDAEADRTREPESAWYLNPSLFWRHPGFTFSAEMEVPVDTEPSADAADEAPDYRLRAVFEKRFK